MRRLDDLVARARQLPAPAAAALLAALTLALCLPGFRALPPVDRDEASFAQASRQMYQMGDYVDIRLHDAPRHKKPVGLYWLQAGAVAATGGAGADDIATYRMVSLSGALVAVLLTWRIAAGLIGPGPGLVAGILLAVSFLLGAEARLAKTDAVLLATVLAAQAVLARLWRAPDRPLPAWQAAAFWAALAAGALVKGPIGPMVVALTALALSLLGRGAGWLRPLRPLPGLALFLALVLPWYVAITLRTDGAFWQASLGRDLLGKVAEGQESHGGVPGFFLATVWGGFWPSSLLLALALPAVVRLRREPAAVFCLAWALPTWAVFEAVPTKLVHYMLPILPALAILAALGWERTAAPLSALWRRAVAVALLALPVAAFAALGIAAARLGAVPPWPFMAGAVLASAAGVFTWRALAAGLRAASVAGLVALSGALALGFYPGLARIEAIWPSSAVARHRAGFDLCDRPRLILSGYGEPSVVFETERSVLLLPGAAAARAMAAAPCALAFVETREAAAFAAEAARTGLAARRIGHIEGMNLGSGRRVALDVLARAP
jgi:4-amino-4-deoxy-L-arabinose transferase-like glycosyltransferase